jgi:hypothetical protein
MYPRNALVQLSGLKAALLHIVDLEIAKFHKFKALPNSRQFQADEIINSKDSLSGLYRSRK